MAERTEIPWTKSTFNPWIGCTAVSVTSSHGPGGCDNCYAEVQDSRKIFGGTTHWGPGVPRLRTSAANWNEVRRWNKEAPDTEFAGVKGFWPVFSASLGDIFDNEVPEEWRRDFWALVKECPNLTFQIVTKRIGNAAKMLPPDWGDGYPNVWLMITVVNQFEADRDIPKLLGMPSVVHGLSMEPLLSLVDVSRYMPRKGFYMTQCEHCGWIGSSHLCGTNIDGDDVICPACNRSICGNDANGLDWVIPGGESGQNARPMHPAWVRSLCEQCADAGVAFLFKQWGEFVTEYQSGRDANFCYDNANTGGWVDLDGTCSLGESAFPRDAMTAEHVFKIGKKAAGRLLDGVLHDEFPHAA